MRYLGDHHQHTAIIAAVAGSVCRIFVDYLSLDRVADNPCRKWIITPYTCENYTCESYVIYCVSHFFLKNTIHLFPDVIVKKCFTWFFFTHNSFIFTWFLKKNDSRDFFSIIHLFSLLFLKKWFACYFFNDSFIFTWFSEKWVMWFFF